MDKNVDRYETPKNLKSYLKDTVQGRIACNTLSCDSPFRFLPNGSTPPSRSAKIKNPFEATLSERLHLPVFSPSVFSKVPSPKTEEKFRWTIEDISSLKPADIDVTTLELFEAAEHDSEIETTAQAKIDTYFNEKLIVPSPFHPKTKCAPLISESTSPFKMGKLKKFENSTAQTVLTFPPYLPLHIEDLLKPYFSYTQDQQKGDSYTNTSLYRQLFDFEEKENVSHSAETSPAPSCYLSPSQLSPLSDSSPPKGVNFGSPYEIPELNECNLSPIESDEPTVDIQREHFSAGRLDFTNNMSVDTSFNVVPDTLDQLAPPEQSFAYESLHNSVYEALSESVNNWEMEYKRITMDSPSSKEASSNEMDISNANTPKSKNFKSQRKKLSDSFLKDENIVDINNCVQMVLTNTKSELFNRNDTTDQGYQTGSVIISEDSWHTSHLIASTPTKNRNA